MFPESEVVIPAWTHPLRIPSGMAMTHADPPYALTGESSVWRLSFKLKRNVSPDKILLLQLWGGRHNKGRFHDIRHAGGDQAGNLVAELDNGKHLSLKCAVGTADVPTIGYGLDGNGRVPNTPGVEGTYIVEMPSGGLPCGSTITVRLGCAEAPVRAGQGRILNKCFVLYQMDPHDCMPDCLRALTWTGEHADCMLAVCTMHVLGGRPVQLRAYAPSVVRPSAKFEVLIRPEDKHTNLACLPPGEIGMFTDGQPLPAVITAVPDSTCLRAEVVLSEEGVYRLEVRDMSTGHIAITNPVMCSNSATPVYWGIIHAHTEMSDGTGTLDQYFHQLKNEVTLDFAATSDHDRPGETPDEYWSTTCQAVKRWQASREFIALLGYEGAFPSASGDGHRNVYYLEDDRPIYRSVAGECPTAADMLRALKSHGEKAIVIPHTPASGGADCNYITHDPDYERLVEIFQIRGSCECSEQDGNTVHEKSTIHLPHPDGYVRNALRLGWRVGFTAGGDDHAGHWGTNFRFKWCDTYYKQGLMSVTADEKERVSIFDAMYRRRTMATTGARIILTYSLNGHTLGDELSLAEYPQLREKRKLNIQFHGTAALKRLDIVRNNRIVHSILGNGALDLDSVWSDTEDLEKVWLPPARFCDHPFAFYYVRATQQDGEIAWASPTWIDAL